MGNKPIEKIFKLFESGEVDEARDILQKNVESIPKEEINRKFEEKNGKTLLYLFVEKADLRMARILLKNPHLDLNVVVEEDGEGNNPLTFAVENGLVSILYMLLGDSRTKINNRVREKSTGYKTKSPLKVAVDAVNTKFVKILLDHPRMIPEPMVYYPRSQSTLMYTATKGNLHMLKLIAERKTIKELNGSYCNRPVHMATFFGQFEIVKYLVEEKQVDFKLSSSLGNVIDICERRRHPNILAFFTEIIQRPVKIISACRKGDVGMVKDKLSRKGRSMINYVFKGDCALSVTCENRNPEILDLLLSHEELDVVSCKALNILCDGTKGDLNREMISKLLHHRDSAKCLTQRYTNKKFKSVDTLGLLCFYGSERDLDNIRMIAKDGHNNNKNFHQTLKEIEMYEGEKTELQLVYNAMSGFVRIGGEDVPSHNMSHLALSIWMKKWPIFEELLRLSSLSTSTSTGPGVEGEASTVKEEEEEEESTTTSRFSPLSTFLHVLPLTCPYEDEEKRSMALTMFQKYVSDPFACSEMFCGGSKIGNTEITDPFIYVTKHIFGDSVVLEILKHPQFEMKDEYLPVKNKDVGLFREIVRRGHSESVDYFLDQYYESHLKKSLDFKHDEEEDSFWNLMICDSPNVGMRDLLIDFHLSQKHRQNKKVSKIEELYNDCHLSKLEDVKELITDDLEGEYVNSVFQRLTPLSIAVKHRDVELLKLLLSHPKIEVNKTFDILEYGENEEDSEPFTPLQYSCTHGFPCTMLLPVNVDMIKLLLEREEIDVNFASRNTSPSAIFMACMSHAPLEVIDLLLAPPHVPCVVSGQYVLEKKRFPDVKSNILAVTLCQNWNMKSGDKDYDEYELEVVRRILGSEEGFDINELTGFPDLGNEVHILVLAAKMGKFGVVKEILKLREDVNVNLGSPTPLQACSELKNHKEFMEMIVSHHSFEESQVVLGVEGGLQTEEERKNFILGMVELSKKLDGEI